MAFEKFKETGDSGNEAKEVKETQESPEKVDRPRNQILFTIEDYRDDFKQKLDTKEKKQDSEEPKGAEQGEPKKQTFLDKMKNLFAKKENADKKENTEKESVESESPKTEMSAHDKFVEKLRKGVEQGANREAGTTKKDIKTEEEGSAEDESKGIEHGEDGERTRYSDWKGQQEHDDFER